MTIPRQKPFKVIGLPQLRTFCDVYQLCSYTAAAQKQGLTTSGIWEQIKGLERCYKVKLFERVGNRVEPTQAGQRLHELIQPLLVELDSVQELLHEEADLLPKRMTIVSNLRILMVEIGEVIHEFRSRFPQIAINFLLQSIEAVQPKVAEGLVDVALTLEPVHIGDLHPALRYEPVGELHYLLIAPAEHPLLRKKPLHLRSVVDYPLILSSPGGYSRNRVEEVFHRHGLINDLNLAVQTSSDEYTVECVRIGLGVGIAIGNPTSPLFRGLGTRVLDRWFGTARIGLLWRKRAHVAPLQEQLAAAVREKFSNSVAARRSASDCGAVPTRMK